MNGTTPLRGASIAIIAIFLVALTVALSVGGTLLAAHWMPGPQGGKPGFAVGLLMALLLWVPFFRWCGFDTSLRKVLRWDQNWKGRSKDDGDSD